MDDEYEYEEEDNSIEEESQDYAQGEPLANREQVMKELFNTEERISLLRHNWRGDVLKPRLINGKTRYVWINEPEKAIAGDRFINKQMSALRSICNPTNAVSKKSFPELLRILHDATDTFIRDLVNEPTIDRKDYRTLAKSFEHTIEMFIGLPEAGHGARVLNDALAGISTQPVKEEKKSGWFTK